MQVELSERYFIYRCFDARGRLGPEGQDEVISEHLHRLVDIGVKGE